MRRVAIALAVVALVACDSRPIDQRSYTRQSLTNIPELQDCVYLNIDNYYRVIRCPKSSTTTEHTVSTGKSSTVHSITTVSE